MTNHSWCFSQSALKASLGLQRLVVINDFTALALAYHRWRPRNCARWAAVRLWRQRHCAGGAGHGARRVGPGIPAGGQPRRAAVGRGGGHVTLAAQTQREFDVLAILQSATAMCLPSARCGAGLVTCTTRCAGWRSAATGSQLWLPR